MEEVLLTEQINFAGIKFLQENGLQVLQATSIRDIGTLIKECDGLIVRAAKITASLLDKSKKLKVVGRYGSGYDNVDIRKCNEKGIALVNVPYANTVSVAEYVIGAILTLAKDFSGADKSVRTGEWTNYRFNKKTIEVANKVLGIVGMGQIGKEISRKAIQGLNMHVKAYDPFINKQQAEELGITLVSAVDELMEQSDFVTLNVPLTKNTQNFIGLEELKKMKKTSFLINASRGGIIIQRDLFYALENRIISGACLDVFDIEPPNIDEPLLKLENVLFSPHIAGLAEDADARLAKTVAQQVVKVLNGEVPDFIVNRELLDKK